MRYLEPFYSIQLMVECQKFVRSTYTCRQTKVYMNYRSLYNFRKSI